MNYEIMTADEALSLYGQKYNLYLSVGNWKVSCSLRQLYNADKICGRPVNMSAHVNHSSQTVTLKDK